MTNKEMILSISSMSKNERILKIISHIKKHHVVQVAGDIVNIVVPAKDQENKIALVAHHDLFPGSAGYNDNSSGVVTLLKLQDHIPDNVELVFPDQEECGGWGCQYYLETNPLPKQAINVDVVGLPGKIFYEYYGGGPEKFKLPISESMEYYHRIPFNDGYILGRAKVPSILMLTGPDHKRLLSRIFEVQHRGPDDHKIDIISEEMMDLVFETIKGMVNGTIVPSTNSIRD